MKNQIARDPVKGIKELEAPLRMNFNTLVTTKVLMSTYRKSLEWEETYRNGEEEIADPNDAEDADLEGNMSEDESDLEDELKVESEEETEGQAD